MTPGEISRSYREPICRCQHFKSVHWHGGQLKATPCTAPACDCRDFDEIPFEDSDLGRAIGDWLKECAKREKETP